MTVSPTLTLSSSGGSNLKPPNPALTVWTCGGLLDEEEEVEEEFPDEDADIEVGFGVGSGDDVMVPVAVTAAKVVDIVQPCPTLV